MFYHAQGMLVNLKMIPSFQAAKYTFGVGDQFDASKQAKMSLFQFGFSRKKRKDNEREEGREVEEVREAKKTNMEENPTEKPEKIHYEGKRVRKYQTTWETDFPWLMFEADKNKMYCKVCRQFPSLADITSSLYTGTGSFSFFSFAIKRQLQYKLTVQNYSTCVTYNINVYSQ